MNRADRRRLEKQGKKNPVMTIKASEIEAIKQKERQKALDAVLPLLLGLPVKVLKEKYGWGTQKRLPDFADALLEVYEEFSKNEQSIEDLMKQVEQDGGIQFLDGYVLNKSFFLIAKSQRSYSACKVCQPFNIQR